MEDLRHLHYFLGLQVLQTKERIFISWFKYDCDLLRLFHMEYCKPAPSPFQYGVKLSATWTTPKVDATLYHQLVSNLLYLTHSCPKIYFSIFCVSRYMQTPHESHWKVVKIILRYIRCTIQFGIHYITRGTPLLFCFIGSIWDDDPDDWKSTTG